MAWVASEKGQKPFSLLFSLYVLASENSLSPFLGGLDERHWKKFQGEISLLEPPRISWVSDHEPTGVMKDR